MPSYNKVLLMGNLTRDPESRFTSSGAAITNFGLAYNKKYTTQNGEQREEVLFVDIAVFGKQGENCRDYLRKGSSIFIEGHLKMDEWNDKKTGQRRTKLCIVADFTQFLDTHQESRPQQGGYGQPQQQQGGYQKPQQNYNNPPAAGYNQQSAGQGYGQPQQQSSYQKPMNQGGYAPPSRPAPQRPAPPPFNPPAAPAPQQGQGQEGENNDDIPF